MHSRFIAQCFLALLCGMLPFLVEARGPPKMPRLDEVSFFGSGSDELIRKHQQQNPEAAKDYEEVMGALMKELKEAERQRYLEFKMEEEKRRNNHPDEYDYEDDKEEWDRNSAETKREQARDTSEFIEKEKELNRREQIANLQWANRAKNRHSSVDICLPSPAENVCGLNILFGSLLLPALIYFVCVLLSPKRSRKECAGSYKNSNGNSDQESTSNTISLRKRRKSKESKPMNSDEENKKEK